LIIPLKIAEGDTRIEVYGGSRAPFAALDGEFGRENGFRAAISRRQVTEAQCGAVNFVRRLRNQSGQRGLPTSAPKLRPAAPFYPAESAVSVAAIWDRYRPSLPQGGAYSSSSRGDFGP
jgi:hypothetical protein